MFIIFNLGNSQISFKTHPSILNHLETPNKWFLCNTCIALMKHTPEVQILNSAHLDNIHLCWVPWE